MLLGTGTFWVGTEFGREKAVVPRCTDLMRADDKLRSRTFQVVELWILFFFVAVACLLATTFGKVSSGDFGATWVLWRSAHFLSLEFVVARHSHNLLSKVVELEEKCRRRRR